MMCLTPNFLISVLNNTKSGIIIAVILFVAAYIIGYLLKYNHPPVLSFKIVRGMIMGLIAFMIFVFIAIRLRYNSDSTRGTTNYILITIRDYIFGCTVNFDHYFRTIKDMDLTKSYDFFAGSNILTANTFWIHKYGYVGTLIIWWLRGFLAGTAYHQIKNGCAGIIEIVILIYVYLNAIYFFTYIPFSYTTVCIGVFILFPFFLLVYREQSLCKNINE